MRNFAIYITVISTSCVSLLFTDSWQDPPSKKISASNESKMSNNNKPVFVAGCNTYHGPDTTAVKYPAMRRNFIALTCALEVPPPFEVMVMERYPELSKINATKSK